MRPSVQELLASDAQRTISETRIIGNHKVFQTFCTPLLRKFHNDPAAAGFFGAVRSVAMLLIPARRDCAQACSDSCQSDDFGLASNQTTAGWWRDGLCLGQGLCSPDFQVFIPRANATASAPALVSVGSSMVSGSSTSGT